MIPKPHYSLINTSKGQDPAVVVVNTALRAFKDRETFPWHLYLTVECKFLAQNGMPTKEELIVIERFEDKVTQALENNGNAIFLARVTCRGERELIYRVHDPDVADSFLQALVEEPSHEREWQYRMEHDSGWALAQPELALLEHDPRFN